MNIRVLHVEPIASSRARVRRALSVLCTRASSASATTTPPQPTPTPTTDMMGPPDTLIQPLPMLQALHTRSLSLMSMLLGSRAMKVLILEEDGSPESLVDFLRYLSSAQLASSITSFGCTVMPARTDLVLQQVTRTFPELAHLCMQETSSRTYPPKMETLQVCLLIYSCCFISLIEFMSRPRLDSFVIIQIHSVDFVPLHIAHIGALANMLSSTPLPFFHSCQVSFPIGPTLRISGYPATPSPAPHPAASGSFR